MPNFITPVSKHTRRCAFCIHHSARRSDIRQAPREATPYKSVGEEGATMKREELRAMGLTEDQINAIMQQNGQDIEAARQGSGDAAAEKARADRLQAQVDQFTIDLAAAQESASSAAALRKSFEELTAKHNATIKANAIRDALTEYKPRDAAMLMRLLDHEKITIGSDGTVSGLKEQVEPMKQASGYLFTDTPDAAGGTPDRGGSGGGFDMNAFLRG